MNKREQKAFADYLEMWLGSTEDRPQICPLCQGPVVKGPGPRGRVTKIVQCARGCMAVCVEEPSLSQALFDVLARVSAELRTQAVEEAPTVRPPPTDPRVEPDAH